jgi:hypothetical protein
MFRRLGRKKGPVCGGMHSFFSVLPAIPSTFASFVRAALAFGLVFVSCLLVVMLLLFTRLPFVHPSTTVTVNKCGADPSFANAVHTHNCSLSPFRVLTVLRIIEWRCKHFHIPVRIGICDWSVLIHVWMVLYCCSTRGCEV